MADLSHLDPTMPRALVTDEQSLRAYLDLGYILHAAFPYYALRDGDGRFVAYVDRQLAQRIIEQLTPGEGSD